ncbi:cystathionine beta-lyase [candidate division KSB3 bacterium]|uniref:cysteine-S-conjugate beta-lyase n=1 Tax=candidate division KSB3 bacterium TaxID=2044937 RepID=A0A2G6E4C6_9BACT|nr:MAG: cystathionine beta-lyase [candidate division KSB3 bacterium]PIE29504.1 MAG: cystathionine beta-lyase [candidate division KSB3 bacterium]
MKYDFDSVIERRGTSCYKWDFTEKLVGEKDALPVWIADIDFKSPAPVIEALKQRVEHGVFGYTLAPDSCYEAIIAWMRRRHGWEIEQDWIIFTPGVVSAFCWAVQAYTLPDDEVVIQPPVYYPFFKAVLNNGRQLIENRLVCREGRYEIDFEDLERKLASPRARLLIFCSPHNPVGRVWTAEELRKLAELCLKYEVTLCSDEIHSDLVFQGATHTPIAKLSEDVARNTVTCMAGNKTFGIPGLSTGFMIVSDPILRQKVLRIRENSGVTMQNLFGLLATEVAYREGEEWLEELLRYLEGNLEFLIEFFDKKIPGIKVLRPDGCYLAWLDCRGLGKDHAELKKFMLEEAKVWMNDGSVFGEGGNGFQRLNFACPRKTLETALTRIEEAVKALS